MKPVQSNKMSLFAMANTNNTVAGRDRDRDNTPWGKKRIAGFQSDAQEGIETINYISIEMAIKKK